MRWEMIKAVVLTPVYEICTSFVFLALFARSISPIHPNKRGMEFNFRSPNPCLPFKEQETSPYIKPARRGNHLRVADILEESEDYFEGDRMSEEDHQTVVYCSSPRRIMGRWFSGLRRRKCRTLVQREGGRRRNSTGEDGEADEPESEDSEVVGGAGVSSTSVSAPTSNCSGTGLVTKESSFNLGVAACLLYLVSASQNELSKVVEMRKQMEMLLQKAKDELPNQSKPEEFGTNSTADELEAELESELALLDLHKDEEDKLLRCMQQQKYQMVGKPVYSESQSGESGESGEVIDPYQTKTCHGGVSAYELERKLHEVLEARQEEQIRQLSGDLKILRTQLLEKEMEISWWKDATKMISKQLPEPLMIIDSSPDQSPILDPHPHPQSFL